MRAFNYVAIDDHGKTQKGVLQADSPQAVRKRLRDRGLTPIEVRGAKVTKHDKRPYFSFSKVNTNDLVLFTRQFATLLAAELPLETALFSLTKQISKPAMLTIVHAIRDKILEGYTLASALKDFPKVFSKLYVSTIEAGEHSGQLNTILERLADYIEQQQSMKQKIQQALIYPALMTVVSFAILTFLLIFVVPNIIGVFEDSGQTLPTLTIVLIACSNALKHYGLYGVAGLLLLFMGSQWALTQKQYRQKWDACLLKLPFFSHVIKTINTARFCRTLAVLMDAGLPVIESMKIASGLIQNQVMSDQLQAATSRIQEGSSIFNALDATDCFTPIAIQLIASGESSGRLTSMLHRSADNQDADIKRLIDVLLSLFEPCLIIFMGFVVLFIVLAILLPIFSMNTFVQ